MVAFTEFFWLAEEVVLEILALRRVQMQVKIINSLIPGLCGMDISFAASQEQNQHEGSEAISALSHLAEGNWFSNVHREV